MSQSGQYDILAAYESQPHRQFADAVDDDLLRVFVRRWGPLRNLKTGTDSVSWYRNRRAQLDATMRLIAVIGGPDLREALSRLILVSDEPHDHLNTFFRLFGQEFEMDEMSVGTDSQKAKEWCDSATDSQVNRVCGRFIEQLPITAMPSFVIQKRGRTEVVRASLFINNLLEALWWMLWEDYLREDPIQFCANKKCAKLIVSDNEHARKFCDGHCAKLVADREYAVRKRAKVRKRKRRKP